MHKCSYCGEDFEPTEAQVRRSVWRCKPCGAKRNKEYRQKRKDQGNPIKQWKGQSEYMKTYRSTEEYRKAKNDRHKKYYHENEENRTKQIARSRVKTAIKNGTLIPKPCEVCKSQQDIEAHHDDYNKFLSVRWLCKRHHIEHHKKERFLK